MTRASFRPVKAREPAPLLPVSVVQQLALTKASPMSEETVPLTESIGRVVSQRVCATEPFPPFPAATMDGYAVWAQDGIGSFPIQGQVLAGHPVSFTQSRKRVSYITTGAPLPKGSNAVVRIEDSEPCGQQVRIKVGVEPGDNVRHIGSDLVSGQTLIEPGTKVDPVALGLLSTAGISQLQVHVRPRATVLSTGDEVCSWDQIPAYGQIRDSNNPTLSGLLNRMGAEVKESTYITQDSSEPLRDSLEMAIQESDLVVSTGGVSMGERDLLPDTLRDMGAELHSERVNMKPGKPFVFATIENRNRTKVIFALPGNPVSAMVTFYIFVALAVRRMQGMLNCHWPQIGVVLQEAARRDRTRPEYQRVSLKWDPSLHHGVGGYKGISTGSQSSSRLLSMLDADALVEVLPGTDEVPAGAVMPALDLRQL